MSALRRLANKPTPAKPRHAVDTQWFLDAIKASAHGSARQVAFAMKLDPSALIRAIHGERRLQLDEAQQLAELLNLSVTEVLTHAGLESAAGPNGVPVVGTIAGDGSVRASWNKVTAQRVPAPPDVPSNTVALAFSTAGGELDHLDGATLICRRLGPVSNDAIGRSVVAQLADGALVYGILRRSRARGRYSLLIGPGLAGARRLDDVEVVAVAAALWLRLP